MKTTTKYGFLSTLEIQRTGRTIAEQLEDIRIYYRMRTGKRLPRKIAVDVLDAMNGTPAEPIEPPLTGHQLCCPLCYGGIEDLATDVNDLSLINCFRCNNEFTPQQAHDTIAAALEPWKRYLASLAPLTLGTAAEDLAADTGEELAEIASGCRCLATATA